MSASLMEASKQRGTCLPQEVWTSALLQRKENRELCTPNSGARNPWPARLVPPLEWIVQGVPPGSSHSISFVFRELSPLVMGNALR
jgi:hypothetical protein